METELKKRCRGFALKQYNEMIEWLGSDFNDSWHVVTISDASGNIEELVGVGKTFSNVKRSLREGWKRLRSNYNDNDFSVDLLVDGRLRSYAI